MDDERSRASRFGMLLALSIPLCLLTQWMLSDSSVASQSETLPPGSQYVSIGSSYAAGYEIQPQEPGAGACGRSLLDYPHLVAAKLHLQLDDVSCGGAVIADALRQSEGANPPQIDAVTSQTRLVTMTIGGNDVGYIGTAIACGQPDSTCTATSNPAQIDAAFQALPNTLTRLIQAVRTKAPTAIIVLVTYPRLVAPTACRGPALQPGGDTSRWLHGHPTRTGLREGGQDRPRSTRGSLRPRSETWALCHGREPMGGRLGRIQWL